MANARKCDRCGACYDPMNVEGKMGRFQNPFFQTTEDIKNHTVGEKLLNDHPADIWIDLCPSCADTFREFMNGTEIPEAYEKTLLNEIEGQRNKINMLNGVIDHYRSTVGDNKGRLILEVEDTDSDEIKDAVLRFLRYLFYGNSMEEPMGGDIVTHEIKIDPEFMMKMLAKEDVKRAEKITNKKSDDDPPWEDVWATIKRVSGGEDDGD